MEVQEIINIHPDPSDFAMHAIIKGSNDIHEHRLYVSAVVDGDHVDIKQLVVCDHTGLETPRHGIISTKEVCSIILKKLSTELNLQQS